MLLFIFLSQFFTRCISFPLFTAMKYYEALASNKFKVVEGILQKLKILRYIPKYVVITSLKRYMVEIRPT